MFVFSQIKTDIAFSIFSCKRVGIQELFEISIVLNFGLSESIKFEISCPIQMGTPGVLYDN